MFDKIFELRHQRDIKRAIGFYLFYLFFLILIFGIFGFILGVILISLGVFFDSEFLGLIVGWIGGIFSVFVLGILLLKFKNQVTLKNMMLFFLGVVLSVFGGLVLGLIIPAYFTTLQDNSKSIDKK